MRARLLTGMGVAVMVVFVPAFFTTGPARVAGQSPLTNIKSAPAANIRTAWGEPDLRGIWTYEFDTPLQRAAQYGTQEFFTPEQDLVIAGYFVWRAR